MTWAERAACRDMDPRRFDAPTRDKTTSAVRIRAALRVCAGCPVQVECLAAGAEARVSGVRGGRLLHRGTVVAVPVVSPSRRTVKPPPADPVARLVHVVSSVGVRRYQPSVSKPTHRSGAA